MDRLSIQPISGNAVLVKVEDGTEVFLMGILGKLRISKPYENIVSSVTRTDGPHELHYQVDDLTLPFRTEPEERVVLGSIIICP